MRYIKKFNEEKVTDWIKSPIIKSKCEYLGLKDYIINDNGTVDVYTVNISRKELKKIPIQFRVVTYNFDCSNNKLTSLKGSPIKCNTFNCSNNLLITLEGGPKEVNDNYTCVFNTLISLDGYPEKFLGGNFYCDENPIYYIYALFKDYKEYNDSLDYNYLRGDKIIKLRFQEACEEADIKVPESIPGYKYI